jgi:hypothetical protein
MAADTPISSAPHIIEPPDLSASRPQAKFHDRAPHIVQEDDGKGNTTG